MAVRIENPNRNCKQKKNNCKIPNIATASIRRVFNHVENTFETAVSVKHDNIQGRTALIIVFFLFMEMCT